MTEVDSALGPDKRIYTLAFLKPGDLLPHFLEAVDFGKERTRWVFAQGVGAAAFYRYDEAVELLILAQKAVPGVELLAFDLLTPGDLSNERT